MQLILTRFAYSPVGTFGSLPMPDGTEIYTVEDSWRNNEPNVSCIPTGLYPCVPRFYNNGGYEAIHITNVENRSHILFHRGNTELDVQGCIVMGMKLGFIEGRWAVSDSRGAFDVLMSHYGGQEFELVIKNYDPAADAYTMAAPSATGMSVSSSVLASFGVVTESISTHEFRFLSERYPLNHAELQKKINGLYAARLRNNAKECLAFFDADADFSLNGLDQDDNGSSFTVKEKLEALQSQWQWQQVSDLTIVIDGAYAASTYLLDVTHIPTGEQLTTNISDHFKFNQAGQITEFIQFVDTARLQTLMPLAR